MVNAISKHSVVSVVDDLVSADLDGEAVILNLKSGIYYGLDDVGARVWSLIQKPSSVSDIRDVILEEYEVEPDRCERDVLSLLQALAVQGLLKIQDGSGESSLEAS